jgi:hypothetical protein
MSDTPENAKPGYIPPPPTPTAAKPPSAPAPSPAAKPGTPPPKSVPAASPLKLLTGTEPQRVRGVKVCYWGKAFSGKTRYMLTWPGVVLITMDPDLETAFRVNRQRKAAGLPEIPIIAPDLDLFHNRILFAIRDRKLDDLIRQDPRFGDHTTRTIAFDSWTFYGEAVLAAINPGGGKGDFAVWQQYKDRMTMTAEYLGGIRAGCHLPNKDGRFYNYVASVHEREFMDDEGKKVTEVGPTVQGQFYDKFFAYYGAVLQCDVETGDAKSARYVVRTKANALRKSMGARLGDLPDPYSGDFTALAKHWGLNAEGATEA